VLRPRENAQEFYSGIAANGIENVAMWTLDHAASGYEGNILIKIDTQGFERQVLDGGKKTAARSKGVLMELPVILLYDGSWHFSE
jgi:FkbM family methyltransferase